VPRCVTFLILGFTAFACSSSESAQAIGAPTGGDAQPADPTPDAGIPSAPVQSDHPRAFLMKRHEGPILDKPELVTITWSADPRTPKLRALGEWLLTSSYWKQLEEYGIHLGTATSFEIPSPAPATLTQLGISSILSGLLKDGSLPSSNGQRLYMFYPPRTTKFDDRGRVSCSTSN
jgi:hypothetical protein